MAQISRCAEQHFSACWLGEGEDRYFLKYLKRSPLTGRSNTTQRTSTTRDGIQLSQSARAKSKVGAVTMKTELNGAAHEYVYGIRKAGSQNTYVAAAEHETFTRVSSRGPETP